MGKGKGEGGWKGSWPARPSSLLSPRCSSYAWIFQWIVPVVQPIEDAPLGQRDDGIRLAPHVVLQRPGRVYESLARKEMRPRCHKEEGEAAALSRGGSIARKKEAAAAPSPAGSTLGSIGVKRIRTLDAPLLNGPNRFSPLAKTRSGSTS